MDDFWWKSSNDKFNMNDIGRKLSEDKSLDKRDIPSTFSFVKKEDRCESSDDELDKQDALSVFKVLNKEDIQRNQERDILKVSSALGVSRYAAAILLHKFAWNIKALQDAWFDDKDGAREYAGLPNKLADGLQKSGESPVCGMCFENCVFDKRFEDSVGFCGHRFCTACLETYVSKAIDDGPECLFLQCPELNCRAVIGGDRVNMLVSDECKMKYKEYLIRSYVEDNKNIEWCPAPDCECAIHYLGGVSYDVTCRCSSSFCWNCLEEAHSPVDCESALKWMLNYNSESEHVTWILTNTQPCPNCKVLIEKTNGVKFVFCLCGHAFCWTCLEPLKGHVREHHEIAEERVENRFKGFNVHYFEKWDANQKAQEKALADLYKIRNENLVEVLGGKQCRKAGGFKFFTEAWKLIVECRRLLKWTYVYVYYMPEEAFVQRELFEFSQSNAEVALERLHDCAENTLKFCLNFDGETKKLGTLGDELIDRTTITRKYFKNLLKGISDDLPKVRRQSSGTERGE